MLCRGVDIILEMLANVNLSHDTKLLANNGRVIVIGSRGGEQELHAELLTDTPGALWRMEQIDATRLPAEGSPLWLNRIVVAVDPAVSTSEGADETGIVACGIDEAGRFYVIDDQSGRYAPHEWAQRAINTYHRWNADRIVIEANQGGAMVEFTLRHVDPNVPVQNVNASSWKGYAGRARQRVV